MTTTHAPWWAWLAAVVVIAAMLVVDLLAHRSHSEVTVRSSAIWSVIWVTCGVVFGLILWATAGGVWAGQYFAGYLIEKSLAVDNIFVFTLLFAQFAVPRAHQHRVLFYGVLGALVLRAGFIAAGVAILDSFHWVLYLFGAFLLYTAWRMIAGHGTEADYRDGRLARSVRRIVPMSEDYDGPKFLTRINGRRVATPLLLVLVLVEVIDVVFAVDSIPAIFAVTAVPFLIFTSNAFAILGLRALYFLLADLVERFVHLTKGLAAILAFVGIKMLLLDVVKVPILVSLAVIVAILAVSVVASLRATQTPAATATTPIPTPAGRPGSDEDAAAEHAG